MASVAFVAVRVDAAVFITEFMASNTSTLADKDQDFPDWLEIYTDEQVDLEGWALTDDPMQLKWFFPPVVLEAGEFLVVFGSGKDCRTGPEYHTNFELDRGSDFVGLVAPPWIRRSTECKLHARFHEVGPGGC